MGLDKSCIMQIGEISCPLCLLYKMTAHLPTARWNVGASTHYYWSAWSMWFINNSYILHSKMKETALLNNYAIPSSSLYRECITSTPVRSGWCWPPDVVALVSPAMMWLDSLYYYCRYGEPESAISNKQMRILVSTHKQKHYKGVTLHLLARI
jgi:hypothetical protein